jgi:hypothetical protein
MGLARRFEYAGKISLGKLGGALRHCR